MSFRALASLLSTLLCSLVWGGWFIDKSKEIFRSKPRPFVPDRHKLKDDLPTMGGLFIIAMAALNILLWCDLRDSNVWIFLLTLTLFAAIGAWDDWSKISGRGGIAARTKLWLQIASALTIALVWRCCAHPATTITFPFFKCLQPDIGIVFFAWAAFLIIGFSNAVNLTDGLDGLAIGSLIQTYATLGIVAYLAGHAKLAHYLCIPYAGTAELAVVGATLVGASLGFLWFNAYPAQIFMGDVGSLALGAGLAIMALLAKQECVLLIAGGLFVGETLSVILQVLSFKLRGKKIFKMAPIHHHFELLGWQEPKIVVRFGIISFVLCLLALMTLKMR